MNLQYRTDLFVRLGEYILADPGDWQEAKIRAGQENGWFLPLFIDRAAETIGRSFLQRDVLEKWVRRYAVPETLPSPARIGIVMAGNIPLVGFHDFLSVFMSGHRMRIKASSKDQVLIKHLAAKLMEWEPEVADWVEWAELLKGCDAYLATGSNNSSRYFEYYFAKYPHIIRRNRTSVAVLDGSETPAELSELADDVHLYFGLGCRNVTKILVPAGYDFTPLVDAFKKFNWLADNHKYKNNYDYNLALHLLNKKFYMSSGSLLLVEEPAIFSPISQLNYQFYSNNDELTALLPPAHELQCIVGKNYTPFGQAQYPAIDDYADGVDVMKFLMELG